MRSVAKVILKCNQCGKEFENTNCNKLYCSNECKQKGSKKNKYKKKHKNTMGDIIKLQEAARKVGMTYGEYVARMGM